jgi:hypothetical protein
LQQVDYRMVRRGLRADGSGPLPQFDLGRWDAFDPDRTMERLAVVPEAAPTPVWFGAHDDYVGPASAADPDMAVTLEIAPEIDADDILEAAAVARPALLLPPRVSVPIDLDRLLAQARNETRKSVDYFHPSTPMLPPVVSVASARPGATANTPADRTDPTVAIARMPDPFQFAALPARRRRFGWIVGTVVAAATATVAVAAVESTVSSARSPQSISVTKPLALTTVAAAPALAAQPVAPTPASDIPVVSFQNLPPAPSGTISLAAVAASHRLFIDGRLAAGDTQTVSCGRHLVQVGSRGVRRYVNVPCGQEVVLAK